MKKGILCSCPRLLRQPSSKSVFPKGAASILLLLVLVSSSLAALDAKTVFNWAFVKKAADGSVRAVDFKERVNVAPGDLFKIYIEPLQGEMKRASGLMQGMSEFPLAPVEAVSLWLTRRLVFKIRSYRYTW